MRERNLTGLRRIASAHQRRRAGRMMRSAKRPPPPLRGRETDPAGGQQGGGAKRFVVGHGWQEAGQAGGEYRFARAGRPDQQYVMAARRSDFKCPPRAALTDHIAHIRNGGACAGGEVRRGNRIEPPVRRIR